MDKCTYIVECECGMLFGKGGWTFGKVNVVV